MEFAFEILSHFQTQIHQHIFIPLFRFSSLIHSFVYLIYRRIVTNISEGNLIPHPVSFVTTRLLPIANVVNNWKRLQNPFFISAQKMFKIQCKDEKHTPAKIIDWSTFIWPLLASWSISLYWLYVNPSQCDFIYSNCWWDLEDVLAALRLGSRWNFLALPCFFCDWCLAPPPYPPWWPTFS